MTLLHVYSDAIVAIMANKTQLACLGNCQDLGEVSTLATAQLPSRSPFPSTPSARPGSPVPALHQFKKLPFIDLTKAGILGFKQVSAIYGVEFAASGRVSPSGLLMPSAAAAMPPASPPPVRLGSPVATSAKALFVVLEISAKGRFGKSTTVKKLYAGGDLTRYQLNFSPAEGKPFRHVDTSSPGHSTDTIQTFAVYKENLIILTADGRLLANQPAREKYALTPRLPSVTKSGFYEIVGIAQGVQQIVLNRQGLVICSTNGVIYRWGGANWELVFIHHPERKPLENIIATDTDVLTVFADKYYSLQQQSFQMLNGGLSRSREVGQPGQLTIIKSMRNEYGIVQLVKTPDQKIGLQCDQHARTNFQLEACGSWAPASIAAELQDYLLLTHNLPEPAERNAARFPNYTFIGILGAAVAGQTAIQAFYYYDKPNQHLTKIEMTQAELGELGRGFLNFHILTNRLLSAEPLWLKKIQEITHFTVVDKPNYSNLLASAVFGDIADVQLGDGYLLVLNQNSQMFMLLNLSDKKTEPKGTLNIVKSTRSQYGVVSLTAEGHLLFDQPATAVFNSQETIEQLQNVSTDTAMGNQLLRLAALPSTEELGRLLPADCNQVFVGIVPSFVNREWWGDLHEQARNLPEAAIAQLKLYHYDRTRNFLHEFQFVPAQLATLFDILGHYVEGQLAPCVEHNLQQLYQLCRPNYNRFIPPFGNIVDFYVVDNCLFVITQSKQIVLVAKQNTTTPLRFISSHPNIVEIPSGSAFYSACQRSIGGEEDVIVDAPSQHLLTVDGSIAWINNKNIFGRGTKIGELLNQPQQLLATTGYFALKPDTDAEQILEMAASKNYLAVLAESSQGAGAAAPRQVLYVTGDFTQHDLGMISLRARPNGHFHAIELDPAIARIGVNAEATVPSPVSSPARAARQRELAGATVGATDA